MKTTRLVYFWAMLVALGFAASPAEGQMPYGPPAGPGAYPAPYAAPGPMMARPMMPGAAMAGTGMPGTMMTGPVAPIGAMAPVQPAYGAVAPAAFGGEAGSCGECGHQECHGDCDSCSGCGWCHKFAVFGEFLYLRARDAEVAYAVPVDGPVTDPINSVPIEVGRTGVLDPDHQPAFRFGFSYVFDEYRSITAQYTMFESQTHDSVNATAPNVLYPLVTHPSTFDAGNQMLDAVASHQINFDLVDLDYRVMIDCCDNYQTTLLVGARYGQLTQRFRSLFAATGTENVDTNIWFEGIGIRGGLEHERYSASRRWLVYGKLHASLLAGEFRADYQQRMSFDPTVVNTSWRAGRIVPIMDLEVGFGWQSKCETWRLTAGYVYSGWYNVVKTDDWIDRVTSGQFVDLGDTMTFDGIVARVEGRF